MTEITDIQIIQGCIRNSRKYQELLFRRYFKKMYAMCFRHTSEKSLALSITHDGFIKVYKNIDKYQHKGSFEGWIFKIMYRCVCDYYRKQKTVPKFSELENDRSMDAEVYHQLDYDEILRVVKMLSPKTKEVFRLYAIEGYRHREIASQMGISINTSKWHLSNARKKLQEIILKLNPDLNFNYNGRNALEKR